MSTIKVTLHDFHPHPGQRAILARQDQYHVACMGRRFGKTELMTEVIVTYLGGALAGREGSRRGLPCAWYAPNDSYFTEVYERIVTQFSAVIRRATTQPRPVIHFRNGGRLDFWTLENPMKCGRGRHYARVVIDEAAHAKHLQTAWEKTISWTLADLNGDAWFISTPYGMNYFHTLYQKGVNGEPGWVSHTASSMMNPYLPEGWMESRRAVMPERVFAQEVLAEFLADGAGVFRGIDRAPLCAWQDAALPNTGYVIGVDWARHNDFTVFAVMTFRGELVHLERFTDIGYELQVGRLKALWKRFGQCPIIAESNSMGGPLIERLQRDRLNVRAFNTTHASKAEAIEALSLALENGHIAFADDPRLDILKAELMAYDQERLPSGLVRYGAPHGQHDDCFVAGTMVLTNNGQIPIETIKPGDMVMTRNGYRRVLMTRSMYKPVIRSTILGLTGTEDHPVITKNSIKHLSKIRAGESIFVWNEKSLCIEERTTADTLTHLEHTCAITSGSMISGRAHLSRFIDKCGSTLTGIFRSAITSIIETVTHSITPSKTLSLWLGPIIEDTISKAGHLQWERQHGQSRKNTQTASSAESVSHTEDRQGQSIVVTLAASVTGMQRVYNLQVEDCEEYFANGVLVHNCVMALAIAWHGVPPRGLSVPQLSARRVLAGV